jgi:hypothetical protein
MWFYMGMVVGVCGHWHDADADIEIGIAIAM